MAPEVVCSFVTDWSEQTQKPTSMGCCVVTILLAILTSACGAHVGGSQVPDSVQGETDDHAVSLGSVVAILDDAYLPTALALIDSALTHIKVVHFEMHNDAVIDKVVVALKAACARGVDVTVLLEGELDFNSGRVAELTAAGCRARIDSPAKYLHAKLLVVDSRRALLGSSNLSHTSVQQNHESNLRVDEPQVASWFDAYADALWQNDTIVPTLPELEVEGIIPYADGGYPGLLHTLVTQAQNRVWIVSYGMNLSSVDDQVNLLADARARGVDVRVLLERSSWNNGLTELNQRATAALLALGIEAQQEHPDIVTHAKITIVDDQIIVGTNNWGYGGFWGYHEVGVVTSYTKAVTAVADYFLTLWAAAAEYNETR
ncbi:MAG: phosphatidylserine/phosphatidylglycerophosphate/cardiolipin synthase family protein [Myxococcales bacterium]|nr:phosphatidylserine/phosphatidylglycerophosphate/cardiolipin synthase family protein [Myxococcales bacterium]